MRGQARHVAFLAAASAVLLVGSSTSPSSFATHPSIASSAEAPAERAVASPGERWFRATRAALADAVEIDLPFADLTGEEATPVVYSFDALAGQTLEIGVGPAATATAAEASARDGAIYIEVFRVIEVLGEGLHQRLTALRPGSTTLRARLPSDSTYHVLIQADTSAASRRFTLELGAALPFPVVGAHVGSIRSLFGATRDAGRRHHEGIDIFVQRLTPVLAVAAGRAMPRQDALGGNTVWLNTPGTSYYYAHLDRIAVRDEQRVKVGDVLGYVGNTGNARNQPSHLHFGVYRWGREAIDPLPLLVGRRFTGATPPVNLATDAG
jgi:murein DD-endopeptidase MepM/ murein hydrolase activator NlpD